MQRGAVSNTEQKIKDLVEGVGTIILFYSLIIMSKQIFYTFNHGLGAVT